MSLTTKKILAYVIFVALLGSISPAAFAKTADHLILKPESHLWLTGDSTLHSYESTATTMVSVAALQKPVSSNFSLISAVKNNQLKGLDLNIPVIGLKSGKKGLDKNMYQSLLSDQYPSIHFHLTSYQVKPSPQKKENYLFNAVGVLSLAGVEQSISLQGELEVSNDGLRLKGKKSFLMTDYGIKPPNMLILKTDNKVVVHYNIVFGLE